MIGMSETARMGSLSAPRRNNYFYGKLMDVLHFQMEQNYDVQQRWLLNRLSLGQGVLCGLGVTPSSDGTQICVAPGVAIDAWGHEIVVPITACLNPWQLSDCGQPGTVLDKSQDQQVYICLSYRECTTDFMPVLVTECNTQEQCSPGTIVETFCLSVRQVVTRQEPPPLLGPNSNTCQALQKGKDAPNRRMLLCTALSGDCAPPLGALCIPLATISLKAGATTISVTDIDTCTFRPRVYSNAVLLDLILCLAARVEQIACSNAFPSGYIPFDQITSTAGPDPTSGDSVVVGRMSAANFKTFKSLLQPQSVNQIYCGPVQLAADSNFIAYVPTGSERTGNFSNFGPQLIDPNTNAPFPNNVIPTSELPGGGPGVIAWRVRSTAP